MPVKYYYRFPIFINLFRWGLLVKFQKPVVRVEEDSISDFFHIFDDD
jgi:hypothetical protein